MKNCKARLLTGMVPGLVATTLMIGSWACTGDNKTTEPVSSEKTPAVPDVPGDAGEGAQKAAGEAQADKNAPATEKSQPNREGAKSATSNIKRDMYVNSGALNVHSGPGMKHGVTRTLKRGEKITVEACEGIWCKIGKDEYVSKRFLSATAPAAPEKKAAAKKAAPTPAPSAAPAAPEPKAAPKK